MVFSFLSQHISTKILLMADIFISYAHQDFNRIEPLVDALQDKGWSVFWDRTIPAGKNWRNYIGKALNDAKCVIVVWSNYSIESQWVSEEADDAMNRNVLVPVFYDNVQPPIGFRSIQVANLVEWTPTEHSSQFDQFIKDVNQVINTDKPPISVKRNPTPSTNIRKHKKGKPNKSMGLNPILVIIGLFLFMVIAYWAYQTWFTNDSETVIVSPPGLVFASKIEADGRAVNPDTIFSQNITDIYAVFHTNMLPPSMVINADSLVQGSYYTYLKVKQEATVSKFGWRWIKDGKVVNEYQTDVEPGSGVWLQRWDYDGEGIFHGDLGPGTYRIVILLDGNPALSSELVITVTNTTTE